MMPTAVHIAVGSGHGGSCQRTQRCPAVRPLSPRPSVQFWLPGLSSPSLTHPSLPLSVSPWLTWLHSAVSISTKLLHHEFCLMVIRSIFKRPAEGQGRAQK